ncbi:hypothetical protein NUU61_001114 [Penicillium alfredii]|uniref:Uncharacterized protein n=1 Tax=Penicillium alfredii TaxID=1506179 RepID=A0A9W9GC86_9EURO|nr:uncharacterized protein NUU61_001114 [Penicillium alfredii]KAJ5115355.1 hypothetical protein NUU61_001114 [Penicillium alfredii]
MDSITLSLLGSSLFCLLLSALLVRKLCSYRPSIPPISTALPSPPFDPIPISSDPVSDGPHPTAVFHSCAMENKDMTLLDTNVDEIKIPTLKPQCPVNPKILVDVDPVIRQGSPLQLIHEGSDEEETPKSESAIDSAPTETGDTRANWLRWATGDGSVFDGSTEARVQAGRALNCFPRPPMVDTAFFLYGNRYIPGPDDQDIYRAVKIEGLPLHVTLTQVLASIRGGLIYSASLLNTTRITGSPTALITFVYQTGAFNFIRHVIEDGFYVGTTPVQVFPICTPTYPLSPSMAKQIRSHGHTRSLVVLHTRSTLVHEVQAVLSKNLCYSNLECIHEKVNSGELTLRFYSIPMAARAQAILTSRPLFQGCVVRFDSDPCNEE